MDFLFLETVGYESALRLSGHHYARLLVERGDRVASISSPVTPLHRLARSGRAAVARRFKNHRQGFVPSPTGALHYVPWAPFPVRKLPLFDSDAALRIAGGSYARDVERRLAALAFDPSVISIQNVMLYPLVRRFLGAILHYRIEDSLDNFPDMPGSMIRAERRLIDEADIVSVTSMQFAEKLGERNRSKLLYLPNAVDAEHFARPMPRPAAYVEIDHPIALYVGALRSWFDWDLLRLAAERLPEVEFVAVSPDAPREDAFSLPNFRWIPGAPYEEIPAYYQHAAALVIPFKPDALIQGVNPLKLHESLAAGTPVVATDWRELRELGPPATLAKDAEEFVAGIARATSEPKPQGLREWAEGRSWRANLGSLLAKIDEVRALRPADSRISRSDIAR